VAEVPSDQVEALADQQQLGVAVDELACRAEVDDRPRGRGDLAQGVNVSHDVVVQAGFVSFGGLEIDIIEVCGKGLDLGRGDVQPQLALGFGQGQPEAPPCGEFALRRPDCAKLWRGVPCFKG